MFELSTLVLDLRFHIIFILYKRKLDLRHHSLVSSLGKVKISNYLDISFEV
jgi:hypothetical protein